MTIKVGGDIFDISYNCVSGMNDQQQYLMLSFTLNVEVIFSLLLVTDNIVFALNLISN